VSDEGGPASNRLRASVRAAVGLLFALVWLAVSVVVWLPISIVVIGLPLTRLGMTFPSVQDPTTAVISLLVAVAAGWSVLMAGGTAFGGLLGGLLARRLGLSRRGWWATCALGCGIWFAALSSYFQPQLLSLGRLATSGVTLAVASVLIFVPWVFGQYLGSRQNWVTKSSTGTASALN
jgi:hypothetical protein